MGNPKHTQGINTLWICPRSDFPNYELVVRRAIGVRSPHHFLPVPLFLFTSAVKNFARAGAIKINQLRGVTVAHSRRSVLEPWKSHKPLIKWEWSYSNDKHLWKTHPQNQVGKSIMLPFLLCSGNTNVSFDMSQAFPWKKLSGSEEFPEIFHFRPKMYQNK